MPGTAVAGRRPGPTGRAGELTAWLRRLVTPKDAVTVPLRRHRLSDTARPWRGSITAFSGGAIIVLVALTVSEGFFNFGVAERGQVIGLVICALALTALSAPTLAPLTGAGIVVAGVVSFPIGLGGLIVGSILSVVGGGLIAAWSYPPQRAVLRVVAAPAWARLGAFAIDMLLLIGLGLFLIGVADDGVGKRNPILYVIPLTLWALVRVWCSAAFGWTPGKLFAGLRLRDARNDELPNFRKSLVREVALLLVVLVALWVGSAGFDALLGKNGHVNLIVLNVVAVPLLVVALLALGRRRLPHDRLLRTKVISQKVVLGPVVARPARRRPTQLADEKSSAGERRAPGTRTA